jgi:hypothetical protein
MRNKKVLLAVLGVALWLVYIIYSSTTLAKVSCEVCIEFRDRTECRTAAGANREEAQRTATDLACTSLVRGMTDSIACGNRAPTKMACKDR